MFTGEGKNELIAAFVKAQAKFGTPKRSKTAKIATRSGTEFRYSYAELEDVMAAVKPALHENGLAIMNNVTMPGTNVVSVTAVLLHTSGQIHETDPMIFQVDNDPKSVGAATTYGKRYTISALCGVASEDDMDAPEKQQQQGKPQAAAKPQQSKPQNTKAADSDKGEQPITSAQVDRLKRIVKEAGVKGGDMKAWLNGMEIADSAHIKRNQYDNIVQAVQSGKVPAAAAAAE